MAPFMGAIFIPVIARSVATKQSSRDRHVGLRPPRDDESTEARSAEGISRAASVLRFGSLIHEAPYPVPD